MLSIVIKIKLLQQIKYYVKIIEILTNASLLVYEEINKILGTRKATIKCGVGAGGDVSRKIDIVAEKTIIDYFKKIDFECAIFGEECGKIELSKKSNGILIMDALDGTTNAICGIPFFCCSLAYSTKEDFRSINDCVIMDLVSKDIYHASKGKGAYYNNKKIKINKKKTDEIIVSVNISGSTDILTKLLPIFETHSHMRHFGANALEMAFFARGLIDIVLDLRSKIRIQDIAAGYLLIDEAGGLILNRYLKSLNGSFYDKDLSFIAANKEIIKFISKRVNALGGI